MEELHCKECGTPLVEEGDKFRCPRCGALYRDDAELRASLTLRGILEQEKLEAFYRARRILYDAAHEAFPSKEAVASAAKAMLSIDDEDLLANVYLHSHDAVPSTLYRILSEARADTVIAREIVRWLSHPINPRLSAPLIDFINRSFHGDELTEMRSLVEDELSKESQGFYETSLHRDVFLCYSSADMPRVLEILRFLEENEYDCFAAFRNLRHGRGSAENYEKEIFEAMANSSVILFLSSNHSRSLNCDALRIELKHMNDALPGKERIEYILDDYGPDIPMRIMRHLKMYFPSQEHCRSQGDLIDRLEAAIARASAKAEDPEEIKRRYEERLRLELEEQSRRYEEERKAKEEELRKREEAREEEIRRRAEEEAKRILEEREKQERAEKEKTGDAPSTQRDEGKPSPDKLGPATEPSLEQTQEPLDDASSLYHLIDSTDVEQEKADRLRDERIPVLAGALLSLCEAAGKNAASGKIFDEALECSQIAELQLPSSVFAWETYPILEKHIVSLCEIARRCLEGNRLAEAEEATKAVQSLFTALREEKTATPFADPKTVEKYVRENSMEHLLWQPVKPSDGKEDKKCPNCGSVMTDVGGTYQCPSCGKASGLEFRPPENMFFCQSPKSDPKPAKEKKPAKKAEKEVKGFLGRLKTVEGFDALMEEARKEAAAQKAEQEHEAQAAEIREMIEGDVTDMGQVEKSRAIVDSVLHVRFKGK